MRHTTRPSTDRGPVRARRAQRGQAMVELAFMIIILVALVLAIFELTVMYYNNSVLTNAVHQATWAAANGAQDDIIREVLVGKMQELLITGYVQHGIRINGIEVHNRECVDYSIVAPYPRDYEYFTPRATEDAAYMYRAEGYHIRLSLDYTIGFSIPFIGHAQTLSVPIVQEARITTRNDLDRDGLVDTYEQEYYCGLYDHALYALNTSVTWVPYSHVDHGVVDMTGLDDDGDGWNDDVDSATVAGEWWMYAKYDRNNDGQEDKFDIEWRKHPSRLHPM
jgi:hypothetical protein